MSFDRDDKRLRFVPVEVATEPPAGLIEHIKGRWWCVDPERGLIFYDDRPACNPNEAIARKICVDLYPWAEVILVPSVFRRIRPQDYCD